MRKRVSVRFSEKLKEHIGEQIKNWPVEKPVAAVLFVSSDGREEELVIGFYDRADLPAIGEPDIFDCDGVEFIVPQTQIHNDLDGRVLDIRDGKILVTD